jgi:hypothetical protein
VDAPSEHFRIEHLTDIYRGPISASTFDGPLRRDRAVETRRVVSGGSGDRFTGIATNPRSGEVCRGTATFSA